MKTKNIDINKEIKKMQLCIGDLHRRIKELEKDTHPPVFKKDTYEDLNNRMLKMEAFFENIYEITTILNEEKNNGMVN